MLKYFHHIIFDPLSAWERFKVDALMFSILMAFVVLVVLLVSFITKPKGAN